MSQEFAKNKTLFLIALASSGMNTIELAKKLGCTQGMLSHLISGKRKSQRLQKRLNRFVGRELKKLRIQSSVIQNL